MDRTTEIKNRLSGISPGKWEVAPLKGKYYGTRVLLGSPDHNEIIVWTPNHFLEPFGSIREQEDGWVPEDGHDHVEDGESLANALLIANAPTDLAYLLEEVDKLKKQVQELTTWKEEASPFLFDSLDGAAGHTADTLNRLLEHEEG